MSSSKLKTSGTSIDKTSAISPVKFPIVGIGASAGGLEALEQFLGKNVKSRRRKST